MNFRINNILCAIDFSDLSKRMMNYAADLAEQLSSELLIFHTAPIISDGIYSASDVTKISNPEAIFADAQDKITQIMSSVAVSWKPVIRIGDPVEEIEKVCADTRIDMIIAGSYGLSGLKRFLHGTIIERMARTISCPLLVMPSPKQAGKYAGDRAGFRWSQIVLACDLSENNAHVFRYVFEMSNYFHSTLHLVHAIESPVKWKKGEMPYGPYEEIQQKQLKILEDRLKAMIPEDIIPEGMIKTFVTQGVPEEVLSAYIRKHHADLIVVGVRHHGALNKILIGATTESVLRKSPCPVLVIPSNFFSHRFISQSES